MPYKRGELNTCSKPKHKFKHLEYACMKKYSCNMNGVCKKNILNNQNIFIHT